MIFTERTVKINNDVASIDSPITLYRGDRQVEILFKIIDSKYKFSSEKGNYIKNIEASFGQLAIDCPDGSDVFTEVTPCIDGAVTFTITGEMIDELYEVGFYSFHIRLFNNDQSSRITIPPIMKGIEIREPIVIEGDVENTDLVGDATVGYSMVQIVGADEEVFDENGNYIPTVWDIGDKITAEKLNKMEEGISNVKIGQDDSVLYVNVKDFGAKGNYNVNTGEGDDDTDALKAAHEHANSVGLPVFYPLTDGAYKISKCLGIPIKTSVYFGMANIFIQEESMTEPETAAFHIIPDEERVIYRNKDNMGWGEDVNELGDFNAFIDNWNNKNTDFVTGLIDYKFYDILIDSAEAVLLRTLGNNDNLMCKREVAKIGLGGIVDYRQYIYDAELIKTISVKKSNTYIELKGGNFIISGNGGEAKYPGFMITRGDVSIKDARWFILKDERTSGGIDGFYRLKNCCDVSFDNIHFFTRGNEQDLTSRQIRDYMLRMETVMNISINKWIERGGWLWHGITGSNIKTVLVTNSRFGTFDTHFNANDLTISNCHFYGEVAIMHSGGGKTIIEGCTYKSGKKVGACFLDFRGDYMGMHKGQLTIRDCEWYDENEEAGARVFMRAMYPTTNVADSVVMHNLPQCVIENCSYYTKNKDRVVDLIYFTEFTSSGGSYVMPFGTISIQNVKSFFVDDEYLKPEHYSVFRFEEPAKSANYIYAYNDRLLANGLHVILDNVSLINNRNEFRPVTYSSAYGIYEATKVSSTDYIVRIDVSNCSFTMNTSDKYSVHANNCIITGMNVNRNIAKEIVLKNCILAPVISGQYGAFTNISSITDESLYNKIYITDCELYPAEININGEKSISYDIAKFALWQSFIKYGGSLVRLNNIRLNYNKWINNIDTNLKQLLTVMDTGYYNDPEHSTLLPKQSDIETIVNNTSTMHVYGYTTTGQIYQYGEKTYVITSDGWITNKFRENTKYYTNTPYKHIDNKIYKVIAEGTSGLFTDFIHSDSEDIVWGTVTLRYVGEAAAYTIK